MIEQFFTCPYCFEQVSVLVDPSVPSQHYVEDCEVCCNPIALDIEIRDGEITQFSADLLGQ